jgi:hypothetical protein
MADTVDLGDGAQAKLRGPWIAFLLAIVTLGIYYLFWYYWINRELRDYGKRFARPTNPLGDSPGTSLLAITIGALIIVPPFVSVWHTFGRIKKAEELSGMEGRISEGLGFVLYLIALFLLPFEIVYAQQHLNDLWRRVAYDKNRASLQATGWHDPLA